MLDSVRDWSRPDSHGGTNVRAKVQSVIVVGIESKIVDAVRVIDKAALQVALIVDSEGTLKGIVTDGDVRRGLLRGIGLDAPVKLVMNPNPVTARSDQSTDLAIRQVRQFGMHHLPIVDPEGRLVGLEVLSHDVAGGPRPECAILMAGGLGRRLMPLTENTPKPLLEVGEKPILDHIIFHLAEQGVDTFYISVNYKAEMIEDFCGAGEKWGVKIRYLREESKLGTAGAIGLLSEKPKAPFLLMNGDIMTSVNLRQMFEYHNDARAVATIGAFAHEHQVPYGVLEMENGFVTGIAEKPVIRRYVSAGVYALSPTVLDFVEPGEALDMPELIHRVVDKKMRIAAFPIREYWIDIGRHDDLQRAGVDARNADENAVREDYRVGRRAKPAGD